MKLSAIRKMYSEFWHGLTRLFLFLFTAACCLVATALIWYLELFDEVPNRILISILIAIVPLGFHPISRKISGLTWGAVWLVVALSLAILFGLSHKFGWRVLELNVAVLFLALPYGCLVWVLMQGNGLLLAALTLAFVVMMVYWIAALIGEPDAWNLLLTPLLVVLAGGVIWTLPARLILESAKRRKSYRLAGPGMRSLAMAVLFLPVILVAALVPWMLELEQVWSAVSLTFLGVLLSAVVAEPLRRFLLEWAKLE